MAMTLRLSPEEDRALTLLARAHNCSKHEAATRAIIAAAARTLSEERVRVLARQKLADYRRAEELL